MPHIPIEQLKPCVNAAIARFEQQEQNARQRIILARKSEINSPAVVSAHHAIIDARQQLAELRRLL
jgi:hypothetical protein